MGERDTFAAENPTFYQRRPFSETPQAYLQGCVALVEGLLEVPDSPLGRSLSEQEEGLRNYQKGRFGKNQPKQISIRLGNGAQVPLLVPRDQKLLKDPEIVRHSSAMGYLFGGESLGNTGRHFGLKPGSVAFNVRKALEDVLISSGQEARLEEYTFIKGLPFTRKDYLSPSKGGISKQVTTETGQEAGSEDLPKKSEKQIEEDAILSVISNPNEEFSKRREFMAKVDKETIRRNRVDFRSVAKVAKEAGLSVAHGLGDLDIIIKFLEASEIPVGRAQVEVKSGRDKGKILRYNVIAAIDEESARQKLGNSEDAALVQMRKRGIEHKKAA